MYSERGTSTPTIQPTSERVGRLLADFGVRGLDLPQREAMAKRAVRAGMTDGDVTVLQWWFEEFEREHGPVKAGGYVSRVMESKERWAPTLESARKVFDRKHASKPYPNQVYQDTAPVKQSEIDYVIERVVTDGKSVEFVAQQMAWPVSRVEELVGGQT